MQDFIIMTRKASGQFRDILEWETATEQDLRRVLMGCLKTATVTRTIGNEPRLELMYSVEVVNKRYRKDIQVKIVRETDKLCPDGTMVCAFVTDIQLLQPTKV